MHKPFSFGKDLRLKQYQDCFDRNIKIVGESIVVYYRPAEQLKAGFIVSRKISLHAVKRNRIKRRLRDVFRLNKPSHIGEFIIIAKQRALSVTSQGLKADWLKAVSKIEAHV